MLVIRTFLGKSTSKKFLVCGTNWQQIIHKLWYNIYCWVVFLVCQPNKRGIWYIMPTNERHQSSELPPTEGQYLLTPSSPRVAPYSLRFITSRTISKLPYSIHWSVLPPYFMLPNRLYYHWVLYSDALISQCLLFHFLSTRRVPVSRSGSVYCFFQVLPVGLLCSLPSYNLLLVTPKP